MPCSCSTRSASEAGVGRSRALAGAVLLLAGLAAVLAGGCVAEPTKASEGVSGAEIWGSTCGRCHFNRSPSWYSDAQWEVALFHMGTKAQLTRTEREAVLRYLKAANGP